MYFYPMALSGRMCMSSSERLSSMGNVLGMERVLQLEGMDVFVVVQWMECCLNGVV